MKDSGKSYISDFLLDLNDRGALKIELTGGKGSNLAFLAQKGIKIPDAVILTTHFFKKVLNQIGGDYLDFFSGELSDDDIEKLREQVEKFDLFSCCPEVEKSIIRRISRWGIYAVRSSFGIEDTEEFSLAGIGESVTGIISPEEMERSVKKVLFSFFSSTILKYLDSLGAGELSYPAVIIQKFIAGEYSGVIFTSQNGYSIVEFLPGTAIPVVQGKYEPVRLKLLEDGCKGQCIKVPEVTRGLIFDGGNGFVEKVFQKVKLPPRVAKKICEMGKKITEVYGSPRDVEWTVYKGELYILQARAVTHREKAENFHWSRVLGEEFWSGVVSPMMYSLVGKAIEISMIKAPVEVLLKGDIDVKNMPGIGLFYEHIYMNLDLLREAFRIIPRWVLTDELLRMFPENMREEIKNQSKTVPLELIPAFSRFLMAGFPWFFTSNYKKFYRFVKEHLEERPLPKKRSSLEEILKEIERIEEELKKFLSIVVWGVTYAYISVPFVDRIFSMMVGEENAKKYGYLLFTNLKGDRNIGFLRDMLRLKKMMPPGITEDNDVGEIKEKFPDFFNELESFLKKYGHRSGERDLFFVRWWEDPFLVLKIIESSMVSDIEELGIREAWRRVKRNLVKDRVRIKKVYLPELMIFLWLARTYLTMRENMRFYADIYLRDMRVLLLNAGEILYKKRILDSAEEVFFLSFDELKEALNIPGEKLKKETAERKKRFLERRNAPDYIVGGEALSIPGNGDHLVGITISPGLAEGRVRVIRGIEDFLEVKEGEIIVMSNLDPGWSSLVGKVAGAVFEVGGLLSHGAIIAREFGIPAIAGIKNAAQILRTGEKVILDATAGTVTRFKS